MENIFSVLFNTSHQFPGWEIVLVLIVLALVLPPLMNHWGRRRSGTDKSQNRKKN